MRLLIVVAASLALIVPAASARPASPPKLIASVGKNNSFTISLTFANRKPVKSIPHGRYSIVVHDYSKLHNFALGSLTRNKRIFTGSIPNVGTKTYNVTLTVGTYVYACSAHPTTMNRRFVVR